MLPPIITTDCFRVGASGAPPARRSSSSRGGFFAGAPGRTVRRVSTQESTWDSDTSVSSPSNPTETGFVVVGTLTNARHALSTLTNMGEGTLQLVSSRFQGRPRSALWESYGATYPLLLTASRSGFGSSQRVRSCSRRPSRGKGSPQVQPGCCRSRPSRPGKSSSNLRYRRPTIPTRGCGFLPHKASVSNSPSSLPFEEQEPLLTACILSRYSPADTPGCLLCLWRTWPPTLGYRGHSFDGERLPQGPARSRLCRRRRDGRTGYHRRRRRFARAPLRGLGRRDGRNVWRRLPWSKRKQHDSSLAVQESGRSANGLHHIRGYSCLGRLPSHRVRAAQVPRWAETQGSIENPIRSELGTACARLPEIGLSPRPDPRAGRLEATRAKELRSAIDPRQRCERAFQRRNLCLSGTPGVGPAVRLPELGRGQEGSKLEEGGRSGGEERTSGERFAYGDPARLASCVTH